MARVARSAAGEVSARERLTLDARCKCSHALGEHRARTPGACLATVGAEGVGGLELAACPCERFRPVKEV